MRGQSGRERPRARHRSCTLAARRPADELPTILDTVRTVPEFRQLQADYLEAGGTKATWDQDAIRTTYVFERDNRTSFVSVTLSSTFNDACSSDFDPDLWLLLQQHGGKYRVVSAPMSAQVDSTWPRLLDPLRVEAAFDLEGDGVAEFASKSDFFRKVEGRYRAVFNLSAGYYSCPC